MFEKERAEIMVLSNIASAQGFSYVADLLRTAEREWGEIEKRRQSLLNYARHQAEKNFAQRLPDLGDE